MTKASPESEVIMQWGVEDTPSIPNLLSMYVAVNKHLWIIPETERFIEHTHGGGVRHTILSADSALNTTEMYIVWYPLSDSFMFKAPLRRIIGLTGMEHLLETFYRYTGEQYDLQSTN